MHVGAGRGNVAQGGHAELAPVAMQWLYVARPRRRGLLGIVVVAPEQIERACTQSGDAAVPAGVHPARLGEEGHADIVELAVGEVRPVMAGGAPSLADEDLQPSLRGRRIARRSTPCRRVPARRGKHRRRSARWRWSPGTPPAPWPTLTRTSSGESAVGAEPKSSRVSRGGACVGRQALAHQLGRGTELLCVEDRTQALRPQAVGGPRPAEPAVQPQVGERDGVAVRAGEADAAVAAVGESSRGVVARHARALAVDRQPRVREQLSAESDGHWVARDAVAGIAREDRRPGSMRQDRRTLIIAEGDRRLRLDREARTGGSERQAAGDGRRPHGFRSTSCDSRVRRSPCTRSNVSRHRPGMCSIRPVTRNRSGASCVRRWPIVHAVPVRRHLRVEDDLASQPPPRAPGRRSPPPQRTGPTLSRSGSHR